VEETSHSSLLAKGSLVVVVQQSSQQVPGSVTVVHLLLLFLPD
jgi:hypothetical protein